MYKTIFAITLVMAGTGIARAQDATLVPVTSTQSCFNMVDALAQKYENNKYAKKYATPAQADKIGVALKGLEKQCEDSAFPAAQKAALDLKALINQ